MKFFALVISLSLLSGLTHANTKLWGRGVAIGNGVSRTYIEVDCENNPVSFGIALTGAVLEGLPSSQHEYNYTLPMPEVYKLPPFEHVIMNWNPHGHEPEEIYGAKHFDFHFYTIPEDEILKITCTGDDAAICMKQPQPDYLPPYYAPTPNGVPMMGWHWVDPRSPEFNGHPFTSTFIYGFYDGKISFVEPMITRDFLLNHGTVDAEIPLPPKAAKSGHYPARYTVSYDSVMDLISVELKQFIKIGI